MTTEPIVSKAATALRAAGYDSIANDLEAHALRSVMPQLAQLAGYFIDCSRNGSTKPQWREAADEFKHHSDVVKHYYAAAPSPAVAAPAVLFNATEAMIDAALKVYWGNDGDVRGVAHNVWNAMCAAMPAAIDVRDARYALKLNHQFLMNHGPAAYRAKKSDLYDINVKAIAALQSAPAVQADEGMKR